VHRLGSVMLCPRSRRRRLTTRLRVAGRSGARPGAFPTAGTANAWRDLPDRSKTPLMALQSPTGRFMFQA